MTVYVLDSPVTVRNAAGEVVATLPAYDVKQRANVIAGRLPDGLPLPVGAFGAFRVFRHGAGQYRRGCRCDDCRAGHARAMAELRARSNAARPARPSTATHGLRSTYVGGCRCALCREASAEYQRLRRQQAREGAT